MLVPSVALAFGKTKLIRKTIEYVSRKFGGEAAEQGTETLARKIEILAAKYGDEGLGAVRKVGSRTFRLVDEAGQHSPPRCSTAF